MHTYFHKIQIAFFVRIASKHNFVKHALVALIKIIMFVKILRWQRPRVQRGICFYKMTNQTQFPYFENCEFSPNRPSIFLWDDKGWIGFDTAEKEPCKVCPLFVCRSPPGTVLLKFLGLRWIGIWVAVGIEVLVMVSPRGLRVQRERQLRADRECTCVCGWRRGQIA